MNPCAYVKLPFEFGGINSNQFADAVPTPDGRFLLPPYTAFYPRWLDLETMSISLAKNGLAGVAKFSSGEWLEDVEKVFMTPYCYPKAGLLDPVDDTIEELGPYPGGSFSGDFAFNRHLKLPDKSLYMIPHNAIYGMRYYPNSKTFVPAAGMFPGNFAYAGGCYIGGWKSFLCPANATKGAIVDHANNTLTFTNCNFPGGEKHVTCNLIDPDTIFLHPHKGQYAIKYTISTDTCVEIIPSNGNTYGPSGTANHIGGIIVDEYRIMSLPYQATKAKIWNRLDNTLKDAPGDFTSNGMFRGAVKIPGSSRHLAIPFNTTFGAIICS